MGKLQLNPFWSEKHVLVTKLSPDQCVERLHAKTAAPPPTREGLLSLHTLGIPVYGEVSDTQFVIRKAPGRYDRGRPLAEAVGLFQMQPQGASIVVHVQPRLRCRGLIRAAGTRLVLWLIVFGAVSAGVLTSRTSLSAFLYVFALALYWLVVFLFGLPVFVAWFTRDERKFLLRFLKETLEAEEVEM